MEQKGYLLLEDGSLFEGVLHGARKSAMAELVFTTAMVGYMETITDRGRQSLSADGAGHWSGRRF